MINFHSWRHRAGGRVIQISGREWLLEICCSPQRRNRFGVLEPFTATLKRWPS